MSVKRIEAFSGEYIAKTIIERSKDTDVIYLTNDIVLDTDAVKQIAKYLENTISKDKIRNKIKKLKTEEKIKSRGLNCSDRCLVKLEYESKQNVLLELLEEG